MSKSLIFLLMLLLLLVSIFLYLRKQFTNEGTSVRSGTLATITTAYIQSTLSLLPATLTVTAGKPAALQVVLNSKKQPAIVQLEISYDPNIIGNIQITPGDYFSNPTIVLETISEDTGRISLAIKPGISYARLQRSETIASISFIPRIEFQIPTTISFLPKTTIRTNDGSNILIKTYNATVVTATSGGNVNNNK